MFEPQSMWEQAISLILTTSLAFIILFMPLSDLLIAVLMHFVCDKMKKFHKSTTMLCAHFIGSLSSTHLRPFGVFFFFEKIISVIFDMTVSDEKFV